MKSFIAGNLKHNFPATKIRISDLFNVLSEGLQINFKYRIPCNGPFEDKQSQRDSNIKPVEIKKK